VAKHDQPGDDDKRRRSPWTNGRGRRAQWGALTAATIEASETIRERAKIAAKRNEGIGATEGASRSSTAGAGRDALSPCIPEKIEKT